MIWLSVVLAFAPLPPLDWVAWAQADLVVELHAAGPTAQVVARCPGPDACGAVVLHVQASTPGRRICHWDQVKITDPAIFRDGFETGLGRWGLTPAQPDGDVRLWLPLELRGCAGVELRVTSNRGSEMVRLDGACAGQTAGTHEGDVWARMGSREWHALVTARGRIKIRRFQ